MEYKPHLKGKAETSVGTGKLKRRLGADITWLWQGLQLPHSHTLGHQKGEAKLTGYSYYWADREWTFGNPSKISSWLFT